MKRIKPMTIAAFAAISLLITVAHGQPAPEPEAPAAIDAGAAAETAAPAEATPDAPEATEAAAPAEDATDAPAEDAKAEEAPTNPAAEDTVGFAKEVWAKYKSREWLPLVGGIMLMLVFLFRKFASKIHKFFDSKKGGYVVNFATAGGVTFGLALWAGESITIGLFTGAIGVAIAAGGGYEHLRDFLGSLFGGDKTDKQDKPA